ncbi:MAG: TIGR03617 family F420-dependent LLM class oxidoreductase [Acidimicrobiales bacterium]
MELELMVGALPWQKAASLARAVEEVGFSGMVFTETTQAPWMSLAAAAMATSRLRLSSGVAVAFARSPTVMAQLAWELAGNTAGRFRLGLGSQVRAHVERRYGMPFDPPGPRMRDYVEAVKACFRAFRGEGPLQHHGPYYDLSLLPTDWVPPGHAYGDIKVDVAAVNDWMCRAAGAVADGVHVHPLHSAHYLRERLLPAIGEGARSVGKDPAQVELTVAVFVVAGDTPEQRAPWLERARRQVAFYGSTRNYAFQFDDLGYVGTSAALNQRLKTGDVAGMSAIITDEVLGHFAVVAPWEGLAEVLLERYGGIAQRLVAYLAVEAIEADRSVLARWGEVARGLAAS